VFALFTSPNSLAYRYTNSGYVQGFVTTQHVPGPLPVALGRTQGSQYNYSIIFFIYL
jgi:hypothetical protein